ncbi:GNAT family N-acetyltransferase [Alkalibacillus almallahensis]|uniref:GNAT family N-acetyltransferase n=1 Tax=Alkalibacillus almallahensis TaxID=1379154 RepID=UPI0014217AD3|nr:GNAT family N-acetyltransferase [Alkalibacillus almallahensis]NIK12022.1 putative acetyltransferase [Alkalibacillus almallahensis]
MSQLTLIKPTASLESAYLDFLNDWHEAGESVVPSVLDAKPSEFEALVEQLLNHEKGVGLTGEEVPASTRWLVDEKYKIIGACVIRHELVGSLVEVDGLVDFGVRPSERNEGHATFMLNEAMAMLKSFSIPRALVTCQDGDSTVQRVYEKVGGMQGLPFTKENGEVVRRFWIDLRS